MEEIWELTLAHLLTKMQGKEISCEEVFRSYSNRIAQLNPKLNAIFDLRSAPPVCPSGPFNGVPFTVKSSLNVKGFVTDHGSLNDDGTVATETVTCVQNLTDIGGYCIGKTTMPEYGKSYSTESRLHGITRNPLNPDWSAGGSSGGCAAAVGGQMVPFSICTDAGGSARVPPNVCGLYGLFPTPGAVPEGAAGRTGLPFVEAMRSVGIIARTSEDLDLVWREIRRGADRDSVAAPGGGASSTLERGGLRIGILAEMNGVRPGQRIREALKEAARWYEERGHQVGECRGEVFGATLEPYIILMGQAGLMMEDLTAVRSGRPRDLNLETPGVAETRSKVRTMLPALTVEGVLSCLTEMPRLRRLVYKEVFSKFDLVLAPVAANGVRRIGEKIVVEGRELQSYESYQFCTAVNFLGLPAVAFPVASTEPVGLQLIGPRFSEELLLAACP